MKKTRQNKNFDLIVFDCDGVLVDSEVISCRAHAETLTRHGYTTKVLCEMLGTKPGVIKALFNQTLETDRTRELKEQMLAAGLPV